MVRETLDHGVLNSWDRTPFITDVDGTPSIEPQWSEARHNFLLSNYHSNWPLDRDDGSTRWSDHHNVLLYGGSKFYLGFNKSNHDNLILWPDANAKDWWYTCAIAMGHYAGLSGFGEVWANNTCVRGIANASVYGFDDCNANNITNQLPLLMNNTFIIPGGVQGFLVGCGTGKYTLQQWQATPDHPDRLTNVRDLASVTIGEFVKSMKKLLHM
jgi:hypothetical protein